MNVKEIMTSDIVYCEPETKLQEVAALMAENHIGQIPICDADYKRVVGVVTDRDITCRIIAKGRNPLQLTADDCMTAPCVTVTPETSVEECCDLMLEHLVRRLPVIDENGQLCGIVSQADIACKVDDRNTVDVIKGISQPFEHAAKAA